MMNYLFIYAFMNIGAFAVIIMLRSEGFKGEDIEDYRGAFKDTSAGCRVNADIHVFPDRDSAYCRVHR